MATVQDWLGRIAQVFEGRELDPRLVRGSYVDLGAQADRARAVAARLNAIRKGPPKQPLLLWTTGYLAVTRRGPWVYVSHGFASRLTDDALAFVIGHEMAHHDLGHLSTMYIAAGALGNWQRIELAADRHGLELAVRAGFSRAAALDALDPHWDDEEPADPFADFPPALAEYLNRFRRSHPPVAERRKALAA
jgi:Zn-dependent protease with chaperone function